MPIQHISAVTLAVEDMARSLAFYQQLGFRIVYGGLDSTFSTVRSAEAVINLAASPGHGARWWGRVIFRVDDADAYHALLVTAGFRPENPRDAAWGERFFHVLDPDGHELSFAQLTG